MTYLKMAVSRQVLAFPAPPRQTVDRRRTWSSRFPARVSLRARLEFTQSFAVMLGARLTVTEALSTAIEATRSKALRGVLMQARQDVQRGRTLSEAFARHGHAFDGLYVHMVRVGEATGLLDRVLGRLAKHLEKTTVLRGKVRAALAYPAVIVGIAVLAVSFFLTTIVPTFAELFAQFGVPLPRPTRMVLGFSHLLAEKGGLMGLLLMGTIGAGYGVRHSEVGGRWIDQVRLHIPLFGALVRKQLVAHVSRTLGTLVEAGVPLVEALKLVAQHSGNHILNRELTQLAGQVQRGLTLHQAIKARTLFPPLLVQMMAVGEQTAELGRLLCYVGGHFEAEIDTTLEGLTAVLEPVLIVVIGLVIGGLLMALYMPLFELVQVIG